ncbi:hypothetical protein DMN91_000338 [Ooceraea biroi]|uniref:Uncharacterized protein n=1 Tax=Ooceraea biroi TaxID=2015173 RepID=A0A3L8E1Y5_OOCBI|nr:hypothetical protein DMN91_000338 [Ooceraea biroi]
MIARLPMVTHSTVWRIPVSDYELTTSLVLSTDLLMIARLPMVTHSTVWRIPVSDYEPLPRVWSCPPTFNDRETATVTHSTVWRIPVSTTNHYHDLDYEPLPRVWSCPPIFYDRETAMRCAFGAFQSRTTNHYHEFGPVHRSFNDRETAHGDAFNGLAHSSLRLRTITTSLVLSTDLLMIARLPMVTHSTSQTTNHYHEFGPVHRSFNDRETAHGDAFNGLAHSSLGLRTITTSLVLFTDHLMIARLSMRCAFGAFPSRTTNYYHEFGPVHRSFNDRETAHGDAFNGLAYSSLRLRTITTSLVLSTDFNDRETAHGDAFNGLEHSSLGLRTITTSLVLSTDLLMIARLPTVTHSTVWRIPVSDYEPLPRVWSCPPTFNDRETAHGDAFNGLAHSSLGLRTITTSLVLFTDHLMIARLSMRCAFGAFPSRTTNYYHDLVLSTDFNDRETAMGRINGLGIPVSTTNHLPRVWSCPPIFNDRETAHGDAFNGLAHSSLRLRTITTSLVLSTDF